MLAIIVYALGIMYSPGPVNLLGLNMGLHGQARRAIGYYLGVGLAMLILFMLFGLAGAAWVKPGVLIVFGALGCGYILYLAVKIARASIDPNALASTPRVMTFRDGLFMQLGNPKGVVATLPIATLQFPAAGIHGAGLIIWSLGLAALAVGAPGSYAVLGAIMGRRLESARVLKGINLVMAALLVGVALSMGWEHVWLPLMTSSGQA
ncbi:Threonine/homoserine/homoserine lactone efflux protein [Kushneria avicenniae]|uniref:Threonine/homoserine/homoserine lactone efflux protein n=1 Tax=Kushneria avicenniae TaxID=402385 RepID=A0A1I1JSK9_9GAMM|nr:LysE family transporter [Kushneria avicenniae]SFC51201.1 Threonine/homoserine/homoserine lactone efflux protein [Kushneria avicenniae]